MREELKDKTRLMHILEAIDNLFEVTDEVNFEEYKTNKILRLAVIKNLEIIGEAAYLLTKNFRKNHPVVERVLLPVKAEKKSEEEEFNRTYVGEESDLIRTLMGDISNGVNSMLALY
ncbi:hypothetical protein EZS27_044475 [termite gut metagenome]|uniref:DUF86 domain-containing protein n=1 Tax=termite gut metagenome TaxID=433724 RepID=A0A5J4P5V7_9ZZZZ